MRFKAVGMFNKCIKTTRLRKEDKQNYQRGSVKFTSHLLQGRAGTKLLTLGNQVC